MMQITDYDPDDDLTDAQYDDWREQFPAYKRGVDDE